MRFDGFYFLFICLLSVSGFLKARFFYIPYFLDMDIEDCMNKRSPLAPKNVAKAKNVPVITTKRNRENSQDSDEDLTKSWRQVLGNPPSRKTNIKEWVVFQKKKWAWQRKQKVGSQKNKRQKRDQVILFLFITQ